jgi:hypothetical protein
MVASGQRLRAAGGPRHEGARRMADSLDNQLIVGVQGHVHDLEVEVDVSDAEPVSGLKRLADVLVLCRAAAVGLVELNLVADLLGADVSSVTRWSPSMLWGFWRRSTTRSCSRSVRPELTELPAGVVPYVDRLEARPARQRAAAVTV